MISINVPNVLTIGIVALLVVAAAKAGLSAVGWSTAWL